MKKYVFISFLAALMCSCTYVKEDCQYHKKTIDLSVASNEWQWDQRTQRFYAHFTQPDLTASIYDYGTWVFTREYNAGTRDSYQVALPESTFKTDTLTDGSIVSYIEHVDYALGIGWVEVTYTISDFVYPSTTDGYLINPEAMKFHLQLSY